MLRTNLASLRIDEEICGKCAGTVDPPVDLKRWTVTPVMLAVYGHVECLELLLKTKSNLKVARQKCRQNFFLWTAQMCKINGEKVAQLLIKECCNVNIAMDMAISIQDPTAVEFLLKAGANVKKKS